MGVDINIDDILVDPSLDETMQDMAEQRAEEVQPSITIDHVIEKQKIDITDELEKMFGREKSKNTIVKGPKELDRNLVVNDPDEIYEKSIGPEDILQQLIIDPVKNDNLYAVIKKDDTTNVVLNNIMREIAEELAYLKAYRKTHYLANEDVSDISAKRVKSLKSLVETIVEKEKLKSNAFEGKIDFYGEKFEKVMDYILNTVKTAFDKVGIPEQYNDIFFTQLAQDLEGFEKKVEKLYYGTVHNTK